MILNQEVHAANEGKQNEEKTKTYFYTKFIVHNHHFNE